MGLRPITIRLAPFEPTRYFATYLRHEFAYVRRHLVFVHDREGKMNQRLTNYLMNCPVRLDYTCDENMVRSLVSFHKRNVRFRQKPAVDFIATVLSQHGKEDLLGTVSELARVEAAVRDLQPHIRDHVVHAVLSYLLGIWLNEEFLTHNNRVKPFEWKLAGLLHDVAYPVEVGSSTISAFAAKIEATERTIGTGGRVGFNFVPYGFAKLSHRVSAFTLLQNRLVSWDVNVNVRHEYHRMCCSQRLCHGIIGSLALLHVIDQMYQACNPRRSHEDIWRGNRNWSQRCFENEVVSAAAAIFVHNLPARSFHGKMICRTKAPLAFLLRLADSFQDWERPSGENPNGVPADEYEMNVSRGKIQFFVPNNRLDKIRKDVTGVLATRGIQVTCVASSALRHRTNVCGKG